MSKQKNNPKIHTEGGAYVGGEVHTGGDFVGRDKIVQAGERGTAIGGNVSGSTIITGDGNVVNAAALEAVFAPVYAAIQDSPRPVVEKEDLTAEVRDIQQVVAHPKVEASWLGRRLRNLKRPTSPRCCWPG